MRSVASLADLRAALAQLPQGDAEAEAAVAARQARLTKPPGSLGRLEELVAWLGRWQGRPAPRLDSVHVLVFAGNHGVVAQNVSAYPASVTTQMVANFERGGAAINQLSKAVHATLRVIPLTLEAPTADFTVAPAMSEAEFIAAVKIGFDAVPPQADLLCLGEMGIGNTTAASALTAVLTGAAPELVTGRGTGIDDAGLAHKIAVITRAITLNHPDPSDPLDVLAKLGGFEIAGLVGLILGGAAAGIPIVVDGFICSAAALVAARLAPPVAGYLVCAHESVELGHHHVLAALGLTPLLQLDLRLGEGTGAALAMPLVDAALCILRDMATFASAGVSDSGA